MSEWPPNPQAAPYLPPKPPLAVITTSLIAINVILFAWQIFSGVDITSPSIAAALNWGADYAPLTFLQEPLRLFSSMFFHFGLPHLLFNMWALYVFGNLAEHTFGRWFFCGLYLLAGLMGSLLSGYLDIRNSIELLQHFDPTLLPRVSAGASGAVMGIGGALTALSFFPRLARQRLALDKRSLVTIMAINLAFGIFATGINNAAHVGGMLMGALLALCWYAAQHYKWSKLGLFLILILGGVLCYGFYLYCLNMIQEILPLWQEAILQMQAALNR
ncbi:membrane associated rhomboid family serine protease [Acinetobacter calcoaceticus]|uniref:Membrane associated rhomboid family serine protease n=1 Tax=Acinetobacter calcoaceticus TaxID=471 RepID=A0A4R1XPV2_ACICA|nr:membrane associated rhomboid family serine protease [Acinetobacter calcoaceticus]